MPSSWRREGQGQGLFANKWRRAVKKWDGKVAEEAGKPKPGGSFEEPDFDQASAKAEEQAKTNPAALFEYLSVDQIKAMPDPDWLVTGLVVEQALGLLRASRLPQDVYRAGYGTVLQRGHARLTGGGARSSARAPWSTSPARAGPTSKFRIEAWEQHNKVLADDSPFFLIRQTINFMKADDVGKLLATVQAIADVTGGPIAAVFVDTVSRVLPGSDENLQKDMTLFVAACDAVRQRFLATVIGLHHTSRNGNIRGSTVIPGAGDFLVEVRREPGALAGSIFATKIKSAEDGWEQFFRVEKIDLPGILPRSSLIVEPVDAPPKEDSDGWPSTAICREIITAIDEQWRSGKPWCHALNSSRSAIKNISNRCEIERGLVEKMLDRWTAKQVIEEDVCDTGPHEEGVGK